MDGVALESPLEASLTVFSTTKGWHANLKTSRLVAVRCLQNISVTKLFMRNR